MKNNYLRILSALFLGVFAVATIQSVYAVGEAKEAKEITQEEAAKKFPDQKGKYLEGISQSAGNAGATPGFFQSPYSSRVYDCRKVKRGGLVVDEGAKKAFVRP